MNMINIKLRQVQFHSDQPDQVKNAVDFTSAETCVYRFISLSNFVLKKQLGKHAIAN